MRTASSRLRSIHHFLVAESFYPLVLSSLLACAIYAGRVVLSHHRTYAFLVWNLFLAWLPYLFSLWVVYLHQSHPRRWWRLIIPGALWLAFLPNAPYIITDFVHLGDGGSFPWWYNMGLLATFAWTGCFLGVVSLSIMQTIVRQYLGRWLSWLFVFSAAGLSGLGIYMGRFLNWNSWDLLVNPDDVMLDMAHRVAHPIHNLQTWGVSLMFAAFLLICYLTFIAARQQAPLVDASKNQKS